MRIQLRDDTNDVGRNEQRENVLKQMREAVATHNTEGVTRAMQQYMNDWVAFGQKRLTMAEFHLDQLKTLILPSQVRYRVLWIGSFIGVKRELVDFQTELRKERSFYTHTTLLRGGVKELRS